MAKRKKVKRKPGRLRRWSKNPVPVSGAGPNKHVVAEYKERTASLSDPFFADHGPPTRIKTEWAGRRHQGYNNWHQRQTEVPGVVHYFFEGKHFLVKTDPATGEMRRSKSIYSTEERELMFMYLLCGRIQFTKEFDPNGLASL